MIRTNYLLARSPGKTVNTRMGWKKKNPKFARTLIEADWDENGIESFVFLFLLISLILLPYSFGVVKNIFILFSTLLPISTFLVLLVCEYLDKSWIKYCVITSVGLFNLKKKKAWVCLMFPLDQLHQIVV